MTQRMRKDEYEEDKKRVHSVLDVLIQENLMGKWVWKSNEVKENQYIPWEHQVTNTSSDIFVWDESKT